MLKLIFLLVLAGIVAVGVYIFVQGDSNNKAEDAANRFENTSEIINEANNAVGDTQNLQDKINSEAQQQVQDTNNY